MGETGNKVVWKFGPGVVEELKDDGTTPVGPKHSYDNVFGPDVTTDEVYEQQCQAIVKGALEGYNGTIFAYGQTSSGKTYTLMGDPATNPGVSLRAFDDVFSTIEREGCTEWNIHVSYFEIYNESVTDLLQRDQ